jgi:hypothetical protein
VREETEALETQIKLMMTIKIMGYAALEACTLQGTTTRSYTKSTKIQAEATNLIQGKA